MEPNNQAPGQNDIMPEVKPTLLQAIEKDNSQNGKTPKKRKKRKPIMTLLRVVISLVLIAIGIFLILFLVARAAKYDSIPAMLQRMIVELELMWQRIIY